MSFHGNGEKVVAWTSPPLPDPVLNKAEKGRSGPDKALPHSITVAVAGNGPFELVQMDGSRSTVKPVGGKVTLDLTGGPQYLTIQAGKLRPPGPGPIVTPGAPGR